jgi:hypothetical protein
LEKVEREPEPKQDQKQESRQEPDDANESKLTTSKLAQKHGMKTAELIDKLVAAGLLEVKGDKNYLTQKGKEAGGEFRNSSKFGYYFLWPESLTV